MLVRFYFILLLTLISFLKQNIQIIFILLTFIDSKNEKSVRSDIKSMVQRMLNTNDILIIDGSNYIKGYRYEIYCITKLYKTPQCIIFCDIPIEHAWLWNERRSEYERYNREIFDALVMR